MEVRSIDRNLHDKIFTHLYNWYLTNKDVENEKKYFFRVRRTNRYNRLKEGFWFHGTENYLLLSFWSGSDWKNKTPNISFLFTIEGQVFLELSGKDSEIKFNIIETFFKKRLGLDKSNLLKRDGSYQSNIYIKNLNIIWDNNSIINIIDGLLKKEKVLIDDIFDSINSDLYYRKWDNTDLGYISKNEFLSLIENIKLHQTQFKDIVLGGTTVSNSYVLNNNDPVINKKIKEYQNNIPLCLNELKILKYKQLKEIEISDIPRNTQWIFITGENGSGKTSILESIAISMQSNIDEGLILNTNDFSITTKFFKDYSKITNKLVWEENMYKKHRFNQIKNFACYGPNRFEISSSSTISKVNHSSKTYNLFNNDGNLLSIENQMLIWKLKSDLFTFQEKLSVKVNLKDRDYDDSIGELFKYYKLYENTKDILIGTESNLPFPRKGHVKTSNKGFLPNVNDMTFKSNSNDNAMYYHCDESIEPLTFKELSTGNKSLLAMVGDIIVRFSSYYEDKEDVDFSNFSGIVLIDEIDAHLHPQWQYEIPSLLSEAFPKIQFIATCHSPIPFLGLKDGENRAIFLKTYKNESNEIKVEKVNLNISELTPNSIFTSPVFDFKNFLSKNYSIEKGYSSTDDYEEFIFQKILQKKVSEIKE
jgi:predicted ATPase